MNSQHQARKAARHEIWRTALAEVGVTVPAAALFHKINYGGLLDAENLPGAYLSDSYSVAGPVTEEECREALADCLSCGWLQIIDEAALHKIAAELHEAGILGPIYGMPRLNAVDFTHAGAALWQTLCARASPVAGHSQAFSDVVHRKVAHYFRTQTAARTWIAECRAEYDEIVSVSELAKIGPWRLQWWRHFPTGFRVQVETRTQWGGRQGNDTSWYIQRSPRWREKPDRLRHIIDSHNVLVSEWTILARLDVSYGRAVRNVTQSAEFSKREFGLLVSEQECQSAFENCMLNGWVTVANTQTQASFHERIRSDPTFAPVPDADHFGWEDVDFTPTGAAIYRMIADEYAGPDWENDLSIQAEIYREEHRYCEIEDGLLNIPKEYAKHGEEIRAVRVVPLGPWCVHWWEIFKCGYRLEMGIGNPRIADTLPTPVT